MQCCLDARKNTGKVFAIVMVRPPTFLLLASSSLLFSSAPLLSSAVTYLGLYRDRLL